MTLASRYIAVKLLRNVAIVVSVFCAVVILVQSLNLLRLVANGVNFWTFMYLLILTLPRLFSYVLPVAFFFATFWVFWQLIRDNEMPVLRASGLSDMGFLRAPLLMGCLGSFLLYIFSWYLNPMARVEFTFSRLLANSSFALSLIQPGRFNSLGDGVTLYVSDIDGNFKMYDIFLHDERSGGRVQTFTAESGQLYVGGGDLRLLISQGSQQFFYDGALHNLDFDEYDISLKDVFSEIYGDKFIPLHREASGLLLLELWRAGFGDASRSVASDSSKRDRYRVEFHHRLVYPLIVPVLVLLACREMLLHGHSYVSGRSFASEPEASPAVAESLSSLWRWLRALWRGGVRHFSMLCTILFGLFFVVGDTLLFNQLKQTPQFWPLLYLFFVLPLIFLPLLIYFGSTYSNSAERN